MSAAHRVARILPFAAVLLAAAVAAQGPFRGANEPQVRQGKPEKPGSFTFCRLAYNSVRRDPSGVGWRTDHPGAEHNFMIRISEFTTTGISRWQDDEPAFTAVRATDEALFGCPFVMMSDAGTVGFSDSEVERLSAYLAKGGFLWADDFWGEASWEQWRTQILRVVPGAAIQDLTPAHPMFSAFYRVQELPQIPSIRTWRPGGSTSEFGAATARPHFRAIFDDSGRLTVLMTHNTDIADGWEREGDNDEYFYAFSPKAYAVGMNVALWVMTH